MEVSECEKQFFPMKFMNAKSRRPELKEGSRKKRIELAYWEDEFILEDLTQILAQL